MQKVHWRTDIPGSPPGIDVVASVAVGLLALCVATWLDLTGWLPVVAFVVGMFATAAACSALRARRRTTGIDSSPQPPIDTDPV